MLNKERLKDLVHKPGVTKLNILLLILSVDVEKPKSVAEIKKLATYAGLRAANNWNVSSVLSRSKGLAIRGDKGWELTSSGKKHVTDKFGIESKSQIVVKTSTSLRKHVAKLTDVDTVNFLNEAISCFECGNYRAAVVLSWVGAISVLQKYVVKQQLSAFNKEAFRVNSKWRNAKTEDDLSRMKERDFLDILARLSIIGKNVKQELEKCLQLRNSCGHPNSLVIGENNVASHIETLILNIFSKFNSGKT